MLFSCALRDRRAWKFVLQDYNDIFSLVTVPNLFLTWYCWHHGNDSSGEVVVTPELKEQFVTSIHQLGIEFHFVIGPWGDSLIVSPQYF
jgi:hypothetical protein